MLRVPSLSFFNCSIKSLEFARSRVSVAISFVVARTSERAFSRDNFKESTSDCKSNITLDDVEWSGEKLFGEVERLIPGDVE